MAWPEYPGAFGYPEAHWEASGRGGTDIDTLIVHCMVGSFEGAMQWLAGRHGNSIHYGVAQDGRIGQGVYEKYAAWHAGNWDYNLRSIGIEHEDAGDCERRPWMTEEMFDASTGLAAHLCKKYAIPVGRIIPHRQVASDGRSCPGPYFDVIAYRNRVGELVNGRSPTVLYRVIAGTFKARSGANRRVSQVKRKGDQAALVYEEGYFRVLVGSFENRTGANKRVKALKAKGIEAYVLPTSAEKTPGGGKKLKSRKPNYAQWTPHTASVAKEIHEAFDVECTTYDWHGYSGDGVNRRRYSIDIWPADEGHKADKREEALGDRIQKYIEANWKRFAIRYLIWWDWILEDGGTWQPYNEGSYSKGNPDPDTQRHMDHLHITCWK